MWKRLVLLSSIYLCSCAVLHHVQISDIDNRSNYVQTPFEIKVSEVGVDLQKAGKTVDLLSRNKNKGGEKAANFIQMFQMGPRTGFPVYSTKWSEDVLFKIYEACPSGLATALTSIRENREYDAVSGEIVKISGICLKSKI